MHPLVNIAVMAARAAGTVIHRHADRVDQLQIERKARNDFVSQIDRAAEAEIIRIIRRAYPDHAILAEESGEQSARGNSEVTWIIDPLDGTTNFLHRIPQFAVSIGIQVKDKLEHGVIYAPMNQDLYTASRGRGAMLNNRRLRTSHCRDISQALIATGVPLQERFMPRYEPMLRSAVEQTAGVRRFGSAALDLAAVAAGHYEGYWEFNLQPWDIAAGIVLVQEAGGVVREIDGGDPLQTGSLIAGNVHLIDTLADWVPKKRAQATEAADE
ncbi:inositol monophosphatase family protein [Sinimarinibacterium sp. NLF-5-8]|uniref:inositol monophosphatase family protein n=1 Tax=Sinimarinibacterium sp. NLF-5-8 TaxID=2698684 RepID=UPI00137C13D1|nr:inositol monophosphatase family protein [Sinimarinibacterium sp. NLF-5-8]QHS09778.1 inositol monophosphatase [Sinimarinibacterium sp. NLF-5-8]